MKITDINSIGWLNCPGNYVHLTPCVNGSSRPVLVKISLNEFNKVRGDQELMKKKALDEMSKSDFVPSEF